MLLAIRSGFFLSLPYTHSHSSSLMLKVGNFVLPAVALVSLVFIAFHHCTCSANYQTADCSNSTTEQMPSSTQYSDSAMSTPPVSSKDTTSTTKNETIANPKPVMGRRLSSKKFQIQSVAVTDDPLYNPSAGSPNLARRKLSKEINVDELPSGIEITPAGASANRTEPEV